MTLYDEYCKMQHLIRPASDERIRAIEMRCNALGGVDADHACPCTNTYFCVLNKLLLERAQQASDDPGSVR